MSKFLWFLGGCATGFMAAALVATMTDDDCSLSDITDDVDEIEADNVAEDI